MMPAEALPAAGVIFEPHGGPFTWWQRRALTRLSEAVQLPWAELAAMRAAGVPSDRQIRKFFRRLEDAAVVAWDPWRLAFRLTDRAALARLLRWDDERKLTAAYRAGRVADSTAGAA